MNIVYLRSRKIHGDPAVGMGNFPIAVYLRLMNGLTNKIPNEKQRKRHILEKMLYMN